MARFTPEQAFLQGRHDHQMATSAVEWFRKTYGELTEDQEAEIRNLVLSIRYAAHVQAGELNAPERAYMQG